MGSLLDIAKRVEQEQATTAKPEHVEPTAPLLEVSSLNSSISYASAMTWPAVYLDDNGDLLFADPAEDRAWWVSDEEHPTWQDLLTVAGVARADLDRWSADPIGWKQAWDAAGRPRNLDVLRARVRTAWRQADLVATTGLLARILNRDVTSVKEAFDCADAADLARLLRYARSGRLEHPKQDA